MMKIDDDTMKINRESSSGPWMMAKNMGTAQGPGSYPQLEVGKGNTGQFTFLIQNPNDVTFANPPFVQKPNGGPQDFKHQLVVTEGGAGKDFMVVESKNSTNGKKVYHYELHFSDGTKLDPIITNNGCCRSFYETDAFLVAGGIMVLAFFAFLVRRLVANLRHSAR